jgi:SAM-dependent methyltransferase
VVISLRAAFCAPRPELVASEMIRVCKPGGRIVMGNWTAGGHIGQMFKVIGQFAPPPANFPSPLLWGDEAACRTRFGAAVVDLKVTRYFYPFVYPFAPSRVVDFFFDYYGPTNRAYASLTDTREALHVALTALWARNNLAIDGTTHVESEYIEVAATRV